MQIIARDDSRLVLHQGPWPQRFMGLVFGASGAGVLAFMLAGHLGDYNAWAAVVVGGVFALAGLGMLLGARDRLCTFDKGARSVTLRWRGLFGSGAAIYAWNDIEDVALERTVASTGRSGSRVPTYRPVLVLKGGARVPWTKVSTSDEQSQAACVAAARAFGGWHQLSDDAQASHAVMVRRAAARARATRYVAMPILAILVAVGLFLNWQQWRRYELWRPTRAVVTHIDIAVIPGGKQPSYRPVIAYRYVDRTGAHDAAGATILSVSSSWSWAAGITSRYRVGDSVTAFIDPEHPAHGFVERRMSWLPLVVVLFPLVLGVFVFRAAGAPIRRSQLPGAADVPILTG